FSPRHRAGRWPHQPPLRDGGQFLRSGQDSSRVHRLCQGQSPQTQHGVGGHGHRGPHCGRAVQDHGRIEMIHVSYCGGGPVMSDLLGGQVQVFFGTTSLTVEQVTAGKLRALAVTSATRWEGLPDIPTVAEYLPGYEVSGWFGIGAPRNTPADII